MNTYGLRKEFLIPIAVRDEETLRWLGVSRAFRRQKDGSLSAIGIKPLSRRFAHFAGGASLISTGPGMVDRYKQIVDEEQLWICPKVSSYRDVFTAFRQTHKLPVGFDVDHALSKELAIHLGYRYVRLTLVEQGANRSAGSSGEKLALTKGPSPAHLRQFADEPILYADPSDLAKLFNVSHENAFLAGVADFQHDNRFIFKR
jgi:hypothetical protein